MEVLQLKRGCRIMLVQNLQDNLKNGRVSLLTGVQGDNLFISSTVLVWSRLSSKHV